MGIQMNTLPRFVQDMHTKASAQRGYWLQNSYFEVEEGYYNAIYCDDDGASNSTHVQGGDSVGYGEGNVRLIGNRIFMQDHDLHSFFEASYTDGIVLVGNIMAAELPTSSASISTGQLWVDTAGGLNIVKRK